MMEEKKTMKKGQVVQLNNVLSSVKLANVTQDTLFNIIDVKIALTPLVSEIEQGYKTAAKELQTPEINWDTATREQKENLVKKRNDMAEFESRYLAEEVEVKLKYIEKDDFAKLVKDSNLDGTSAVSLSVLLKQ